jgi:aminomuconate-semialdehyde/2-hydroxymuconate-6-semialdehyde dehydrogenase
MVQILNFIGGEFIAPHNNRWLDNINPATGEKYGTIPDSDESDVALAVEKCRQVQSAWAGTPLDKKAEILQRISDLILENLDRLAEAESIDNGKPLALAKKMDIPRAAQNFSFFASALKHYDSEFYFDPPTTYSSVLRVPIGIVGCISPWNLPLYLFTWKIAPAIAAGNCVIAKPSEVTPMTSYLLSEIVAEAGLPAGVLNIVHGSGPHTGNAIVAHPEIKAISFTGGTATGAIIARTAAPMFKKLSLELGGKNPAVIFDDCDYDKMLSGTIRSSFTNQGQICLCTSRIIVQDTIYEQFKQDFKARTESLRIGNPLLQETDQGALVSAPHLEKIDTAVKKAMTEGGHLITGGKKIEMNESKGYYFEPTILENLGPDSLTNQEEIFGPVVTLQSFHTKEEALQLANNTKYGLAATVWSKDTNIIHYMSHHLESGIVWVNCWLVRDLRTPFGGVKSSGVGREGGWDALRFFTEPRSITQIIS